MNYLDLARRVLASSPAVPQTPTEEPARPAPEVCQGYDINDLNDQSPSAACAEPELAEIARDIEKALGLPAGSLELVDPHRCNDFCRCDGRPPPPKRKRRTRGRSCSRTTAKEKSP
jgi:hypothetical protein